jgi:hypothetical protein
MDDERGKSAHLTHGRDNQGGAKVAKGRKDERGYFGVKRNAEARRSGRKTLRAIWKRSLAGFSDFVLFGVFRGFLRGCTAKARGSPRVRKGGGNLTESWKAGKLEL